MITNKEIEAVKLSATKKDFYQIWNELIEVAGKISDRWDPATTNESDPGIVLLKVLTAIADKLNYNIDANTLEAFMPSAAQTESMRNLCEMMGYNIKYYQSAATKVTVKLNTAAIEKFEANELNEITLPMFTVISNQEKDVNYVTLESKNFSPEVTLQTINVMEGQHVQCETINNNVVTIDMLDDNNRFYLPESQIAENGIFIYKISDGVRSGRWEKVESLHTVHFNNLVYKFGYDSKEGRPYVQFPEDIGQIIDDGLEIHYIRTSGEAGNTAAFTLTTLETPGGDDWKVFSAESDFVVSQMDAAANGSNIESITNAYKNFKRTVGTFETLVTCRDYMNKIYNLMEDANVPMVSNIIVSDIRDDINRSVTLCSFNDFGICYVEKPVTENGEALIDHFDLVFYPFSTVYGYNNRTEYMSSFIYSADNGYNIQKELEDCKTVAHKIKYPKEDEIVLIKNYLKLDARIVTTEKVAIQEEISILSNIKAAIYKEFNLRNLDFGEEIPFDSILDVIENADARIKNVVLNEPVLYTKFATGSGAEYETCSMIPTTVTENYINLRHIGKELYNKLTIRNILAGRLELFNYNTKFTFGLNETKGASEYTKNETTGDIAVSKYYAATYPNSGSIVKQITSIKPSFTLGKLDEDLELIPIENHTLTTNQEIKFRSPNFITDITYPAYVNYFLKLEKTAAVEGEAAEFITLFDYMKGNTFKNEKEEQEDGWSNILSELYGGSKNYTTDEIFKEVEKEKAYEIYATGGSTDKEAWSSNITIKIYKHWAASSYKDDSSYGALYAKTLVNGESKYIKIPDNYSLITETEITDLVKTLNDKKLSTISNYKKSLETELNKIYNKKAYTKYYTIGLSDQSVPLYKNWLYNKGLDLYRALAANYTRVPGYLVDVDCVKYEVLTSHRNDKEYLKKWFVPKLVTKSNVTRAMLGRDADYGVLDKDCEYQLGSNEYLLINYTPSSSSQTEDGTTVHSEGEPISIYYGPGEIIKPNFEMGDSTALVNGKVKAFSKKNVDFSKCKIYKDGEEHEELRSSVLTTIGQVQMLGLGSDEQIEHRKIAQVKLDKGHYVYWALDEEAAKKEMESSSGDSYTSYTLKDNEYFFIASSDKSAMSYYGSGTQISIDENNPNFFSGANTSVSLEDILANGIAGVPWVYKQFTSNNKLTITEYKYITLTDGDVINAIDVTSPITANWQSVKNASYTSGGEAKKLPNINVSKNNKKLGWEVQSLLLVQSNSNKAVKLMDGESITLVGTNNLGLETSETIVGNSELPISIKTSYPLNGAFESISTEIDEYTDTYGNTIKNDFKIRVYTENPFGVMLHTETTDTNNNKVYEESNLDTSIIKHHNFGDNLTNVYFNTFKTVADYIKFETNIPEDCYGLIMMYYTKSSSNTTNIGAYLESDSNLKIFNNVDASSENENWWKDQAVGNKYYLRPGINIIKIENTINSFKLYPDSKLEHNVVFSDLDVIYKDNDINLDLIDYQWVDSEETNWVNIDNIPLAPELESLISDKENMDPIFRRRIIKNTGESISGDIVEYNSLTGAATHYPDGVANKFIKLESSITYYKNQLAAITNKKSLIRKQLLDDINALDPNHDFYYNCLPDNSRMIDINTSLLGTEDAETMSSPRIWYDSNNINNKFVVSEIDAIYLEDGIKIARSSKR